MNNVYMTDYYNLYTLVLEQNERIEKNITEKKEIFSTDDQLFNYIDTSREYLVSINSLLLLIYYILFIGLAIILLISPKNTTSIYLKFILIIILGILPFIYLWVELKIWNFFNYIWSLIKGHVFKD